MIECYILDGEASNVTTPGCMVLEGGAFRGLYTQGVLDVLMQEGINLACTIGVSAFEKKKVLFIPEASEIRNGFLHGFRI